MLSISPHLFFLSNATIQASGFTADLNDEIFTLNNRRAGDAQIGILMLYSALEISFPLEITGGSVETVKMSHRA